MTTHNDDSHLTPDVLAALLAAVPPVAPPPGLKSAVMTRIGLSMPAAGAITVKDADGWMAVSDLLDIKLLFVDEKADSVSFLLRGKPGASVPAHHHSRYEECLVLEGDVQVGDMHTDKHFALGPGDFHCAGAGSDHPVLWTRGGTLVYLRTAIADSPVPLRPA